MSLPENQLQRFRTGEPLKAALSAARLNPPLERIDQLSRQVNRLPRDVGEEVRRERFVGLIVTAGPNGEADFGDERYWVHRHGLKPVTDTTSAVELHEVPASNAKSPIVAAVNLSEITDGTHTLPELTVVEVFVIVAPGAGTPRYAFIPAVAASDASVVASVDSVEAGGGEYAGTLYAGGTTTADGSADLSMPEGLTVGAGCLILNERENGQQTHHLELGSFVVGKYVGMSPESTPRPTIVVDGGRCRTLSPVTLSPDAIAPGATLDPNSWDRDAAASAGPAYGDTPLLLWFVSSLNLDTDGTVLGINWRTATFDAGGKLVSVTSESNTPP